MGLYQNHVLPFVIHLAMSNRELTEYRIRVKRERTVAPAAGATRC